MIGTFLCLFFRTQQNVLRLIGIVASLQESFSFITK